MKEFLLGITTSCILAGLIYAALEMWRKRVTFVTHYGIRVYDLGMQKKNGWTLPREQVEAMEIAFLLLGTGYGFTSGEMISCFSKLRIFYSQYPMLDPRPLNMRRDSDSGFVNGFYYKGGIWAGIQPKISRTSIPHEVVHFILEQKLGNSDPLHAMKAMWEGDGCMVSEINRFLREKHDA